MRLNLKTDSVGRAVLQNGLPQWVTSSGRTVTIDPNKQIERQIDAAYDSLIADGKTWATREYLESIVPRDLFEVNVTDGDLTVTARDRHGVPVYSMESPGQPATPAEAVETLLRRDPHGRYATMDGLAELRKAAGEAPAKDGDRASGEIRLTEEQAKDPRAYRRAKAEAAKTGKEIVTVDGPQHQAQKTMNANAVIIPQDANVQTYRRMRQKAIDEGLDWDIA